jgi:hypothetical protein
MTHPNLTTPALLSLLAEFDHNCEDKDGFYPGDIGAHRKTFSYALEGVQAMIDRGELVTREDHESARVYEEMYAWMWGENDEQADDTE